MAVLLVHGVNTCLRKRQAPLTRTRTHSKVIDRIHGNKVTHSRLPSALLNFSYLPRAFFAQVLRGIVRNRVLSRDDWNTRRRRCVVQHDDRVRLARNSCRFAELRRVIRAVCPLLPLPFPPDRDHWRSDPFFNGSSSVVFELIFVRRTGDAVLVRPQIILNCRIPIHDLDVAAYSIRLQIRHLRFRRWRVDHFLPLTVRILVPQPHRVNQSSSDRPFTRWGLDK